MYMYQMNTQEQNSQEQLHIFSPLIQIYPFLEVICIYITCEKNNPLQYRSQGTLS